MSLSYGLSVIIEWDGTYPSSEINPGGNVGAAWILIRPRCFYELPPLNSSRWVLAQHQKRFEKLNYGLGSMILHRQWKKTEQFYLSPIRTSLLFVESKV